mgnify:CR=1 FL=1|jgi:hypothetical protein
MLILHFFFSHSYKLMLFFPFSYMIFLIYSSYNADEKVKAPQEYYLWGLNQLKK